MKNYFKGAVVIFLSIILPVMINLVMLNQRMIMFNPNNKGSLFVILITVPLVGYWLVYTVWYMLYQNKSSRNLKNYASSIMVIIFAGFFCMVTMILAAVYNGFLDEAQWLLGIDYILSTAGFVYSMLKCRPY